MYGLRDSFRYLECANCGCLSLLDLPTDWSRYYPGQYYSYNQLSALKRLIKSSRNKFQFTGRGVFGRLAYKLFGKSPLVDWIQRSGVKPSGKVLDVGCGSGNMLLELQGLGFKKLVGIDPFMDASKVVGEVHLKKIPPTTLDEAFDLIMMHHSFEHVLDPERDLRHLARCLTSDGRMIVRIPVADCWAWRTYGVNWVQLDPPRHTFLLTDKSMRMLADRCDLEVFDKEYDSASIQIWGSELYKKDVPLLDRRSPWVAPDTDFFDKTQLAEWDILADKLNKSSEGDQVVYYLKKKSKVATS